MSEHTIATPTACPKSHSAATLLDAYQEGRLTRDELLDHLLEWRKAPAPAPATKLPITDINNVHDNASAIYDLCTAVEMMAVEIDECHQGAVIRVAQAIKRYTADTMDLADDLAKAARETAQ